MIETAEVPRSAAAPATRAAFKRFLRLTPAGKLRIDRAAIKREGNFDGKFLLRTSDEHLPAEDIALGHKGRFDAERGWRDTKSTTDLRACLPPRVVFALERLVDRWLVNSPDRGRDRAVGLARALRGRAGQRRLGRRLEVS